MKVKYLGDVPGYIRMELCVFSMFISSIGYLLYAGPSPEMLFAATGSFCVCAGAYSFNNVMDKSEDRINRKKLNPMTGTATGNAVTAAFFAAAVISCIPLGALPLAFCAVAVLTSVVYSAFRLKRFFLLKNLYTGFGVTQVFLVGASAAHAAPVAAVHYVVMSAFIFMLSVVSDLRDFEGDRQFGVRTIPVTLGFERTRRMVMLLMAAYATFILALFPEFVMMVPFIAVMEVMLLRSEVSRTHRVGSLSFIGMMVWLFI